MMARSKRPGGGGSVWLKVLLGLVAAAVVVGGALGVRHLREANDVDAVVGPATPSATAVDADSDDDATALALGKVATIGPNYRVAVTEVTRYTSGNSDFLQATIEATYIGKRDGELWADLDVEYFGRGPQSAGESDCRVDLGDLDADDQDTLKKGDTGTYAVCIDLPKTNLRTGKISVQEAFSTRPRTYWSTAKATTEDAPSPAASSTPAAQTSSAQTSSAPVARAAAARPKWTDDQQDALEHFEDQKRYLDKTIKALKAADGSDGDIDDYEDWRDSVEKQINALRAAKRAAGE